MAGTTLSAGKLEMYMLHNGNIGGITAYNGTAGQLSECVSGKWFLNNKSEATEWYWWSIGMK